MVVNPITIRPEQTLADARALMERHRISGIPVTEKDGRLVGILTNRDVRFAENPRQPVAELMTRDNLVTVGPGVTQEEARRQLHQHRIEKLLVVDEDGRCIGLITVKDIEKAVDLSRRDQGWDGTPARRRRDHGRRQGLRALRGADRRRMRPDRHRHRPRPQSRRRRGGRADPQALQRRPDRRRQRRHRRSHQGADRRRRGRGEGRHRPRLDLHHPRRRRRRRAAAHRDHGFGGGSGRNPARRSSPTAASGPAATSPRRSPPAPRR